MEDGMELKDFVSQTLRQITEGIRDARKDVHDLDGDVNPPQYGMEPASVDFEVSVTTVKEHGKGGGFKVGIAGFGAEGNLDKLATNSSAGTIKFSVPLRLPLGESPEPNNFDSETRTKKASGGGIPSFR